MPLSGVWKDTLGDQVRAGLWLIYGREKNGKTTFALMLANHLSTFEKVLYISAEEGTASTFVAAIRNAGISYDNKSLHVLGYISVDDLFVKLKKHKCERIVFIDNLLIYRKEITEEIFNKLKNEHSDTLFIFIAHEDKKEPYPGNAEICQKLASVIFKVNGMAVKVSGRGASGTLVIDEERAALYHGSDIINNQNKDKENENGN
jgi:hypothetical protein